MTPSVTQSNVTKQLRAFLLAVLPPGVAVVLAQGNRVPEPQVGDFVVMTPIRQERIETNVDDYADAAFTGSIAGATMTITDIDDRFPNGKISIGSTIYGVGVNTVVTTILSGSGQVGTYTVDPPVTVGAETLSAGAKSIEQQVKFTVQLDFHSALPGNAGDMAVTVSTLMRDGFAVDQFANQSPNFGVVPLLADDARQMPFQNAETQLEWRWVVDCWLQVPVVISVPQQFADSVDLDVISVDAEYAP